MSLYSDFNRRSWLSHEAGDVLEVNSFVGLVRSDVASVVPLVNSLEARVGASLRSVLALKGASVTSRVGFVTHADDRHTAAIPHTSIVHLFQPMRHLIELILCTLLPGTSLRYQSGRPP